MPEFALLAEEDCVPLDVLSFLAEALDLQMRRDVAPVFGGEPWTVTALSSLDGVVDPSAGIRKVLTFRRRLDVAGALGFHTDTMGVEYAEAIAPHFDDNWIDGTTASHEIIETFCDPACDQERPWTPGNVVDYETCDPVEADQYSIDAQIVNDHRIVSVSSFVFPAWFGDHVSGGPYDFLRKLKGPFTLTPGGYFRVVDRSGDEHYITSTEDSKARIKAKQANPTSRVARRNARHLAAAGKGRAP